MTLTEKIKLIPWYKKIKILRIVNDWTQDETAEKCGVAKRIYWNWENGTNIPIKKNRAIVAKVFEVFESDIFSDLYKEQS